MGIFYCTIWIKPDESEHPWTIIASIYENAGIPYTNYIFITKYVECKTDVNNSLTLRTD